MVTRVASGDGRIVDGPLRKGILAPVLLAAILAALLPAALLPAMARGAEGKLLWEIGKADDGNAEFALAPNGYARFGEDGFFVVGESDSKKDWPYVQPGPVDGWAGGREHSFTILFGLKSVPGADPCRLRVDLLDTHGANPPRLRVDVNGTSFERELPRGGGDASVFGDPKKGKAFAFDVEFPAKLLKVGDNEIRLTTLSGSWILHDWIGLETPPGAALVRPAARTIVDGIRAVRALVEKGGAALQPVTVTLRHFGPDAAATVKVEGGPSSVVDLKGRTGSVTFLLPAVQADSPRGVTVEVDGKVVAKRDVVLKPVRRRTIYILPHSHTDIGYTEIQTAIEDRQVDNLVQGMRHARETAGYPEGARFVWNVEVLWAADLYLRRLPQAQKQEFLEAVKSGQVALNGMYLNELTGLCRPEELLRLFRFATKMGELTGVPVDSVMISDVPGYTWGTVTAMAQAGIRYFSTAPNYFDRIGTILKEWENKPFWWLGPDGTTKVLVWIPYRGYALSHIIRKLTPEYADELQEVLEKGKYPYDIAYVRWSGHGDNAVPDPSICEFVKDWSSSYTWPRFIISSTSEAFRAFETRHGDDLPVARGDWTPYWEDGAGSSALETSMNRWSSDRLTQAEALHAMLGPESYRAAEFEDAWNKVLLYSEHTWGAWCSVTEPERKETQEQWEIKKGYALEAHRLSQDLLARALQQRGGAAAGGSAIEVINTLSWPRTDLVIVPREMAGKGDRVVDDRGRPVPSQRLVLGYLAFLASDVPPLGTRSYAIEEGVPHVEGRVRVSGNAIENDAVRVRVDEATGAIVELVGKGIEGNLVDTKDGEGLNEYLYLIGDDVRQVQRSGPATIRVLEPGPLVGSLLIESDAPGTRNKLGREVRLVAGLDSVWLTNIVDKKRLDVPSYMAREGKESLNFGFPFRVPGGELRLDVPFGVMRPEADQIPSACKNWFTVGRWADVSSADRGITWVTLDAPLLQVGGLTATLLNSQTNPEVWRKKVDPTQRIYSWAMNNHWGTNYRAWQEGPVPFRFVLRPHGGRDAADATRFAVGCSQPLIPVRAARASAPSAPLFRVEPADVIVTGLKPSDDGKAWIVRLFAAADRAAKATLEWREPGPRATWRSDTSERPLARIEGPIEIPAFGLVTLRVDR